VDHLLTLSTAQSAENLPTGRSAQEVDVASTHAIAAVKPVLDALTHGITLEHRFD
jgi:hypothetical protein